MAKTRSQTGNRTIKKEEEEEDCKSTLRLKGVTVTTRNKITKGKGVKSNNRLLLAQKVKVEEDTDTKSLLKSASNHSKISKGQSISQEQINQFIDYVVNHGMSVTKASRMAKMSRITGLRYYNEYKNDPDKKIPLPRKQRVHSKGFLTQEHVENLVRYIVADKMPIPKASAKANMTCESGRYYYGKYLKDPDHSIPIPSRQHYMQDQKNEFIGYIVNDKMNITQASKKAKINIWTGRKHYYEYFKVQHPDIPTPSHIVPNRERYSQEQIKEVIGYIINDKMTITAASRKGNMHRGTAVKYYHQYLKDHNMKIPASKFGKRLTQDHINELIGYIVDDKMSITAASKKANVTCNSGSKYYKRYLIDHYLPVPVPKRITQDEINRLIGYIVDDTMSITAASKKAKMSVTAAYTYYRRYLKDKKRGAPTRRP